MIPLNAQQKKIVLLTNTYPYGTGETFLHEEIGYLAKEFSRVYIYPLYLTHGVEQKSEDSQPHNHIIAAHREVPSNIIIMRPLLKCDHKSITGLLFYGLLNFAPLHDIFKEFFKKRVWKNIKRFRIFVSYALMQRAIIGNRRVLKEMSGYLKENDSLLYCYWGDKSAMILPYLKRQMGIKTPFVVRFHGSDIFEEAKGILPFREKIYDSTDYACPVSQKGADYIKENYPCHLPKNIIVSHLGSINKFPYRKITQPLLTADETETEKAKNIISPTRNTAPIITVTEEMTSKVVAKKRTGVKEATILKDKVNMVEVQKVFKIISCSNIISLKRVGMIAEAIIIAQQKIREGYSGLPKDLQIEWLHIGGGPMMEEVLQICKGETNEAGKYAPERGTHKNWFTFTGALQHSPVMELYRSYMPSLFIHASMSEGIPVSIMEAMSFGVPVIATDVGGTGELFGSSVKGDTLQKSFDNNSQTSYTGNQIGFLIPGKTTGSELANYLLKFMTLPGEEREAMSNNAHTMWEKHWNADENYAAFAKHLAQLN